MKKDWKDSCYLESSAILAWLLEEPNFEKILARVEKASLVCTSVMTLLEARRILTRSDRLGGKKSAMRRGNFERSLHRWEIMELTPEIQRRVGELFPVEPVRTHDAIHLATAIEFAKSWPNLQVLTLDKRIIENLVPLGMELAEI